MIDLETGALQLVDRKVFAWAAPYLPLSPLGDDMYDYPVIDGERSGVWLVRLP